MKKDRYEFLLISPTKFTGDICVGKPTKKQSCAHYEDHPMCHPLKKLGDGYIHRNHTGYLYATVHLPSASIDNLDHGIRSNLLPKASARPRIDPRGARSEAANSLRTSLARMIELVATGGLVWCRGESIVCSEDGLIGGANGSVESGKAGGYNGRQRQQ